MEYDLTLFAYAQSNLVGQEKRNLVLAELFTITDCSILANRFARSNLE